MAPGMHSVGQECGASSVAPALAQLLLLPCLQPTPVLQPFHHLASFMCSSPGPASRPHGCGPLARSLLSCAQVPGPLHDPMVAAHWLGPSPCRPPCVAVVCSPDKTRLTSSACSACACQALCCVCAAPPTAEGPCRRCRAQLPALSAGDSARGVVGEMHCGRRRALWEVHRGCTGGVGS